MGTLDDRLATLEKDNRKLKWVCGFLMLLTLLTVWNRGTPEPPKESVIEELSAVDTSPSPPKKLVIEELSIVDASGEEVCSIRSGRPGPPDEGYSVFELKGGNGVVRMEASEDAALIGVTVEKETAFLAAGDSEAEVTARSEKSEASLGSGGVSPTEQYPGLTFKDGLDHWRGGIGVGLNGESDNAMSVRLMNPDGEAISLREDGRIHLSTIEAATQRLKQFPSQSVPSDPLTGNQANATMNQADAIVASEQNLLRVADRQSKSDYKHVQDLIRRVKSTDIASRAGWDSIDKDASRLSSDTLGAYHSWRAAIIAGTSPKYSIEDVENMTSTTKPEFSSPAALKAKAALLNAANATQIDRAHVRAAIRRVEKDGEWSHGDRTMEGASSETMNAYRAWKDAVLSSP